MADCELCGAMKVGTRAVIMGRAEVQACKRCTDKMGLQERKLLPAYLESTTQTLHPADGGIGRKGKDIMLRGEKELASDFSRRVTKQEHPKAGIRGN